MKKQFAFILFYLVPCLWAGVVLGAGVLAVFAVFDVPENQKVFAYAAAARVFERLSTIEWGFLGLLLLSSAVLGFPPKRTFFAVTVSSVFLIQDLWLHPSLAARTAILVNGGQLEPSLIHPIFAGLTLIKLTLLFGISFSALNIQRSCLDRAVFAPSK